MLGRVLGHYRIEAKLGEGGMGVVYRARDEHLQRDVAIKVLAAGTLADRVARDRFRTEALSLSRLSHPSIATVYDFDTQEGVDFLVLEYLPGQPLSRSLAAGPLPEAEVVRLGSQVAEALVAAHAAGVIHRDLKPGNLMVLPDGHVKILDFGLAKLRAPASEAAGASTTTGVVAGTLPYMAPEQLRGERVDGRTDLYALGVVLYEMTTGQVPYGETTALRLADAILHAECAPPSRLRPGVSPGLEGIILRCLAKDPARRYQAAELLADLRRSATPAPTGRIAAPGRWTRVALVAGLAALLLVVGAVALTLNVGGLRARWFGSAATVARDSVAVLPLKNLSGDPEQDYFGAGLTEDIISHLAKIQGLKVISRTSVDQYRNTTKSLKTIAEELDVDTVLEGSVRRTAGRVRIAVQLIDARTDAHLWAETYDRDLSDIFAVQTDVARQVAAKLEASLASQGPTLVEEKPTSSPEAYDRYLRAVNLYPAQGVDQRSLRAAIQLYEDAVNIDPSFALAWARLAQCHASMWWLYYDRSAERPRLAKAALDRAAALQPNLPEMHSSLGFYHLFVHLDYDRALAEFEIARKRQPGASGVVLGMGLVKRRQGRFEDALSDLLVSVELDPRSPTLRTFLCDTYAWLRKTTQANDCLDRILALDPARGDAFYGKAYYHLRLTGDVASARSMLQRAERLGLAGAPVAYRWVSAEMAARDYEAALRRLSASPGEAYSGQAWFLPKTLLEAQIRALQQDSRLSARAYRAARAVLEQKLRDDPEDPRYHSALGLALAGLGLKAEAIRAGQRATELLPVSTEAIRGPHLVENLAHIYAMVGEADLAIDRLEYLMSIPGDLGYGALKFDPAWDPVRSHPRFQRLLERAGK